MIYKNITVSCYILSLIIYSCSSSKQQVDQKSISVEDQFAKARVEKIDDISFKSINYSWRYINKSEQNNTIKKSLEDEYPNPFSPSPYSDAYTWFVIETDSFDISLLDASGKSISTLFKDYLSEGLYQMKFADIHINSGVYFIVMAVGKEKFVKKFNYVK